MSVRLRVPPSPDERRAKKAARQARWRANKAIKDAVAANIEHSMGLDDRPPPALPAMPQADLANLLRDRYHKIIDGLSDEDLMDKDLAPSLTLALKTQKVLDDREKVKSKTGTAEIGRMLIAMMEGRMAPPPKQIEDGMTVEGTAVVIDE